MNRRSFFKTLTAGIAAAFAPTIFIPKLIKPVWKPALRLPQSNLNYYAIYNGLGGNWIIQELGGNWIIQEHTLFAAPMPAWMPKSEVVAEAIASGSHVIIHDGPGFNVVATSKPKELLEAMNAGRVRPLLTYLVGTSRSRTYDP